MSAKKSTSAPIATTIEYHGTSDERGRCHFSFHWEPPTGTKRAQHFFADADAKSYVCDTDSIIAMMLGK